MEVQENQLFIISQLSAAKKSLYLYGSMAVLAVALLLYCLGFETLVPFLLIAASLAGEIWWANRYSLSMSKEGLVYGKKQYSWQQIHEYSNWGPVGISFTPLQLRGIEIHLEDGKVISVSGYAPGYDVLREEIVQIKKKNEGPSWHYYPRQLARSLRYFAAFLFCGFFALLLFLKWIMVVASMVLLAFYLFRTYKKSAGVGHNSQNQLWLIIAGSLVVVGLAYLLLQNFLSGMFFYIGLVPVIAILWFPWRPAPLLLFGDHLFFGVKRAYSLSNLQQENMVSKLWLLKIWRLEFTNGIVEVYPFLERFSTFQKNIKKTKDSQKKQESDNCDENPKTTARKLRRDQNIPSPY